MNETLTAWQLMLLTIKSLPVEFWRVILTVVGASFSLGNDTQTLVFKSRTVFYATIFGYLATDAVVTFFSLTGYANGLFAVGGIGGNWLAGIVLEAFQEARANWKTIVPYVWAEIKDSIPIKEWATKGFALATAYLTAYLNRKKP